MGRAPRSCGWRRTGVHYHQLGRGGHPLPNGSISLVGWRDRFIGPNRSLQQGPAYQAGTSGNRWFRKLFGSGGRFLRELAPARTRRRVCSPSGCRVRPVGPIFSSRPRVWGRPPGRPGGLGGRSVVGTGGPGRLEPVAPGRWSVQQMPFAPGGRAEAGGFRAFPGRRWDCDGGLECVLTFPPRRQKPLTVRATARGAASGAGPHGGPRAASRRSLSPWWRPALPTLLCKTARPCPILRLPALSCRRERQLMRGTPALSPCTPLTKRSWPGWRLPL
jgi:hypothetical protein